MYVEKVLAFVKTENKGIREKLCEMNKNHLRYLVSVIRSHKCRFLMGCYETTLYTDTARIKQRALDGDY